MCPLSFFPLQFESTTAGMQRVSLSLKFSNDIYSTHPTEAEQSRNLTAAIYFESGLDEFLFLLLGTYTDRIVCFCSFHFCSEGHWLSHMSRSRGQTEHVQMQMNDLSLRYLRSSSLLIFCGHYSLYLFHPFFFPI